jgi:hypothetical protein
LPGDGSEEEIQNFHAGMGGYLEPVLLVDKDLNELTTFADLVEESKQLPQEWQMVLIASLAGKNGVAPSAEVAEEPLKRLVKTVKDGGDLSQYVLFDRAGDPVTLSRG